MYMRHSTVRPRASCIEAADRDSPSAFTPQWGFLVRPGSPPPPYGRWQSLAHAHSSAMVEAVDACCAALARRVYAITPLTAGPEPGPGSERNHPVDQRG